MEMWIMAGAKYEVTIEAPNSQYPSAARACLYSGRDGEWNLETSTANSFLGRMNS